MEPRPRNCPNRHCLCLFHTYDEEERLCFGVLPQEDWVDHDGLLDFMRRCEDGEPTDFNLPDAEGKPRSLAEFKGKVVLVFFGFAQCPDVCPTALGRAIEVRKLLGADGERVQVVFITVDPERDTPQVLREYMKAYDPSFIALRGNAEQLAATAKEFKVYFQKVPTSSSYTMDHTAVTYAFDPQGRLRLALKHEQSAQDVAADLRNLLRE